MGYENHFFVRPVELSSQEELRELPIPARKCRFLDEVSDGSLYNVYTQDLCLFQCRMEQAFRKCGCVPWNYLHWPETLNKTCNRFGSRCFELAVQRVGGKNDTCDCPPDCNSIEMTVSKRDVQLNVEKECSRDTALYKYLSNTMNSRFNAIVEA